LLLGGEAMVFQTVVSKTANLSFFFLSSYREMVGKTELGHVEDTILSRGREIISKRETGWNAG
jgi:hypothetical protein